MTSAVSDGFELRAASGGPGIDLVVTGSWTPAAAKALASGRADGLVCNYALGFRERDLDFIEPWPLRRLDLLARTHEDLEPIYRLSRTLSFLKIDASTRARIDLERLPQVTELYCDWPAIRDTIKQATQLQTLLIAGYAEPDLLYLANNSDLRDVTVQASRSLRSLLGIEAMPLLERIEMGACRGLADLSSLPAAQHSLTAFCLSSCGSVTNIEALEPMTKLKELWIANCGPIASLRPIAGLREITTLYMWESTRVGDGDLTPLLNLTNLKDLRLMNRRHYQPAVKEIEAALGLAGP